ncbi:hypothetical protein F1559_001411 [Cyanidiococcus yangmingshanensis]|uniref:Csm1 N-terminal domain-containing protein n=1 Tax=Cyanidiococcus yangmingshanensis TaxID=2690220 RepID=A0A7J7IHD3_9RHOD|nr:hypothetical protein F1559_001411 [Cyanidiococcus yangmingshanensis]
MDENQVITEPCADVGGRTKLRRLSQVRPLGDIQENSYGIATASDASERVAVEKRAPDAASSDRAPTSVRSSSKDNFIVDGLEQLRNCTGAGVVTTPSTTSSSVSVCGESAAQCVRASASEGAVQAAASTAGAISSPLADKRDASGVSAADAGHLSASMTGSPLATVALAPATSPATDTNPFPIPPSGAASTASSKRPAWTDHDESGALWKRTGTWKLAPTPFYNRETALNSALSETQSTSATPIRPSNAGLVGHDTHATTVSGRAPAQRSPPQRNTASPPVAPPPQHISSGRISVRPPSTAMTWSASAEMNTSAAIRAFEEYRASVAAQLDAAERLVERYKSENEQLRTQLSSDAEPAKLRQRLEELERERAEQQVRYLELENRALQLEAELARESVTLERERAQLAQLENDAAPAAALFQLCAGATQVKPIRVRYESTETTPEGNAKNGVASSGEQSRPQAVWLNGYQVLLENSQSQRRALFQLVLDDSGDIEYTPLELRLGDAATEAPDFLHETIYFPRNELPLFWQRLVSTLF